MARKKHEKHIINELDFDVLFHLDGKIFAFDLETTGLDPRQNGIIQMSYRYYNNGVLEGEDDQLIAPFDTDKVDLTALQIHGHDIEQIKKFQKPQAFFQKLQATLKQYVDPFNKTDKMFMLGYNVNFDIQFLRQFFLKNYNNYFGAFFSQCYIDVLAIVYLLAAMGRLKLPNYKLETVCKYFNIQLKAHDALSDIKATQTLYIELLPLLKKYI